MDTKNFPDLQVSSLAAQVPQNGGQSPAQEEQVNSPIDTARSILDNMKNQPCEAARQMADLMAMRIRSAPLLPAARAILAVDDVNIIDAKDFYLVKGKIKSGKSSLLKAFMCAIIAGQWNRVKSFLKNGKILYFDTEQKPQDCQSILTYCKTMTGCSDEYLDEHVMLFSVRKRERSLLMDDLAMQVSDWKPDLIIVDGLADCVRSFNDEVECSEFVHRLLCIVEDNDCALIGLIHENKASDDFNPKGHLGSLSQQKAAMIFETRKVGDIIKVTTSAARHKSMPDWYIRYDEDGMMQDGSDQFAELVDTRTKALRESNRAKAEKLTLERIALARDIICSNQGRISRADLTERMAKQLDRDRSTISGFISSQLGKAFFLVNDMIQESPETDLPFLG